MSSRRPVCVGGPPGGGKSTAGRLAAEVLSVEYRSAGELFRAEARRHGMDLGSFSRYAETHPEVDRTLDAEMVGLAVPGRLIDARLTGVLLRRSGLPTWYVVVTAREEVRAQRIAERDGVPFPEALRLMRDRERSERERYREYYGVDLSIEPADVTIDSSGTPPDAVAREIVAFIRQHENGESG